MRNFISVIIVLVTFSATAQEWEDRRVFGGEATGQTAEQTLRIISSTDTFFFAPILESFVADFPNVSIEYLVTGTADVDRKFRQDPEAFDLVISSAMDLQLKLANDGFALKLATAEHHDWAQWRQSLFGFTSEPAAIVINPDAFEGFDIPQTRQELIQAIRARPDVFRNKLGTYDVRESGLGYLFATQDARASETFWRLMEVMGGLEMQLYCCSGEMIDDITSGTIYVAYNVLGSYAAARQENADRIEIILPSDFPTIMMRTAFVSALSQNADLGAAFITHLIAASAIGSDISSPLPPLLDRKDSPDYATIALEPALMIYLDEIIRRKFVTEWENAVIQD